MNVIRYERLLREDELIKNSSKGTYYRDPNFDIHAIDTSQDQAEVEVYLAELVKGDTYACPMLAKSEVLIKNEPTKEENKKGRIFSFDVIKADVIFESPRITFKSTKKMAVDKNPLPHLVDVNMVVQNLDKFGLLRFNLVVHNAEDELHPSDFECLKGNAVVKEERSLCARCQKEVGNITEGVGTYRQQI
ncbi:putative retroelement [Abeliophyllum distichum]|uniref:Retroelement n=1 Tax=Abeliophyllum distichum TaxID=126358 RepID=A0ABD1UNF6_9LAMI